MGGDVAKEAESPGLVAALAVLAGKRQSMLGESESVRETVDENASLTEMNEAKRVGSRGEK